MPTFFQYAKDKSEKQVNRPGNGVIDRIYNHIKINRFRFANTTIEPLDWRKLMFNPDRPYGEKEEELVAEFRNASSKLQFVRGNFTFDDGYHNLYEIKKLKEYMDGYGRRQDVCDVLIRGLFGEHKTPYKAAFWMCYNDVVYDNLSANLTEDRQKYSEMDLDTLDWRECNICGNEYKARPTDVGDICPACRMFNGKARTRRCLDCGVDLPPVAKPGGVQLRCEKCQKIHRRKYKTRKEREYRAQG